MESTALIPKELMKKAEEIQYSLAHPNPNYSVNMPILPVYLGKIFPLHPLNKILGNLEIVKVLNYI